VLIPEKNTEKLEFTAVWELDTYTVTYYDFNGMTHGEILTESFILGDLPIQLPDLYLNNKFFISWYSDQNFENPITEITEYKDISLYAKFVDATAGLVFTYNGESYDVTGYNGEASVVYVPELYNNTPVTSIAAGAFAESKITEINLPITIEEIGERAFFSAKNLKAVNMEKETALGSIGKLAFSSSGLESIEIPDALTVIAKGAFSNCTSLKTVIFSSESALCEIEESAFEAAALEEITLPKSLNVIGKSAFFANVKLKSVHFANNSTVYEILDKAFASCSALTAIAIPDSVNSIGTSAFENDKALVTVELSKTSSLTEIGEAAFKNCDLLSEIFIPVYVSEILENTFYSCNSLASVKFASASHVTKIGVSAFESCASLVGVKLPMGLVSVEENAFKACSAIEYASFGPSIEKIAKQAFAGCPKITSLKFPAATVIEEDAFKGTDSLTELVINMTDPTVIFGGALPATLKTVTLLNTESIAAGIFAPCTQLETLTLPFVGLTQPEFVADAAEVKTFIDLFGTSVPASLKTVTVTGGTYVSAGAFKDCSAIETIILPDTTDTIGAGAFEGCLKLSYLELPLAMGLTDEDNFVFTEVEGGDPIVTPKKTLAYLFADVIPQSLKTVKLSAYSYSSTLPESIFAGSSLVNVTLEGFSNISNYAFKNVKSLKNLNIDACYLTSIGEEAFAGCDALTSFTVPSGVYTIAARAFEDSAIEKFEILGSRLESIGTAAFRNCDKLTSISIPRNVYVIEPETFLGCKSLIEINLPYNLNSIGESAFESCVSLAKIALADSEVEYIGAYAFKNSGLRSVSLPFRLETIETEGK